MFAEGVRKISSSIYPRVPQTDVRKTQTFSSENPLILFPVTAVARWATCMTRAEVPQLECQRWSPQWEFTIHDLTCTQLQYLRSLCLALISGVLLWCGLIRFSNYSKRKHEDHGPKVVASRDVVSFPFFQALDPCKSVRNFLHLPS